MPLSLGIVGLPNIGKSTLFNALTKKQVDCANYPFCTIEPNKGTVAVPDFRLEKLSAFSQSKKITPTIIEFVDIAGLVKNAHQGEGLGNQFLAHIREVDAIVEVVREFSDKNISHVNNKIDPKDDMATIALELIMADLQTIDKRMASLQDKIKAKDKNSLKLANILQQIKDLLEQEKFASEFKLEPDEENLLKNLYLLTLKPLIYALNIDEGKVNARTGSGTPQDPLRLCAKLEQELSQLDPLEAQDYLKTYHRRESGLDSLIRLGYQTLDLITFFTTGEKETRAWTVPQGALAPQAAGKIHSDFATGFIRAETVNWQELIQAGSWAKARELGTIKAKGKNYVVQDGDTCLFLFA